MFSCVQVRAPAGSFKDIDSVVTKSRVVVRSEAEPLAQSEVLSTLDQVFMRYMSVLCSIQLSLNSYQSTCPYRCIRPPKHDATTTRLHQWDGIWQVMSGAWSPPDMMPNSSTFVSSDQRILFLTKFLPSPHRISGAQQEWPSGSFSPLLPRPSGCSTPLPKYYWIHCSCEPSTWQKPFCGLLQNCASTTIFVLWQCLFLLCLLLGTECTLMSLDWWN